MSDVIETYIRRNSGMTEDAAFEEFLKEERIRSWVGADESRKERLRREFTRVWASLHPPATTSRASPQMTRPPPAPAPKPQSVAVVRPQLDLAPKYAAPAEPAPTTSRRLEVLCPVCGGFDVWIDAVMIVCHRCKTPFENMLDLIPVKAVGILEFWFGTGWRGLATMVGIVVGFALLYVFLQVLS